jgi:hypothetical protein
MFTIPQDAEQFLTNHRSEAAFRNLSDGTQVKCEIRDTMIGRVWAEGIDDTEPKALAAAIKNADASNLPKTPAQLAEENIELKQRIAELEGSDEQKSSDPLIAALESRGIKPPVEPGKPNWRRAAEKAVASYDAKNDSKQQA